jgi:hypothetical protein
VVSTRPKDHGF